MVMPFQFTEIELQMARQPRFQRAGIQSAINGRLDAFADHAIELAENLMTLKPELCEVAEIGVRLPGLTGISPQEKQEFRVETFESLGHIVHGIASPARASPSQ